MMQLAPVSRMKEKLSISTIKQKSSVQRGRLVWSVVDPMEVDGGADILKGADEGADVGAMEVVLPILGAVGRGGEGSEIAVSGLLLEEAR